MISIDIGKFRLSSKVVTHHCLDGSVRLIKYTEPEPPEEYVTMRRRPSYYGESMQYDLSVHLPPTSGSGNAGNGGAYIGELLESDSEHVGSFGYTYVQDIERSDARA